MTAYDVKPAGTTYYYLQYAGTNDPLTGKAHFNSIPVVMGDEDGDVVAVVLDWEDGSVLDWFASDTYWETAQNVATWGRLVVLEGSEGLRPVAVAIREAELHADCFGK